jgi:hypothetical protein
LKRFSLGLIGIAALLAAGIMPAYAQTTLTGSGTGSALCSGGGPFAADIIFHASSGGGTTGGTYTITYTAIGIATTASGIITSGHLNDHHFRLEGLRVSDPCTPTKNIPISIEGRCGTGVTITYKLGFLTPGGSVHFDVAGTFTGDVSCT